ncbi:hypothetical protein, partial [Aeromonas hydrophila]|uniref:hypothetical protein n=1 Tax=Aeromonas hydrophila TaxID=644 RepID=UPI0036D7F9FF
VRYRCRRATSISSDGQSDNSQQSRFFVHPDTPSRNGGSRKVVSSMMICHPDGNNSSPADEGEPVKKNKTRAHRL